MPRLERVLRYGVASFGVVLGLACIFFVVSVHQLTIFSSASRPFENLGGFLAVLILPLVFFGTYRPKTAGFVLLGVAGVFLANMFFRRLNGELLLELQWWKRHGSAVTMVRMVLPVLLVAVGLVGVGFSRFKDRLRRPWVQFWFVLGFLGVWAICLKVVTFPSYLSEPFSGADRSRPYFGFYMHTFIEFLDGWLAVLLLLTIVIGSKLAVRNPEHWGRWILLASAGIACATFSENVIRRWFFPTPFWPVLFLGVGGAFLLLGLHEREGVSSSMKKGFLAGAMALFMLSIAGTGVAVARSGHKIHLRSLTKEVRTYVRWLTDLQISVFDETGQFLAIPPNVSEVPKGTCEPLSRIPESWMKKTGLNTKWFEKVEGEPCFRYRYQVVVCPGSAECETKRFQKDMRWKPGDPTLALVRGEGDLDGDGIISLYEKVAQLDSRTGEIPCGVGFYVERAME